MATLADSGRRVSQLLNPWRNFAQTGASKFALGRMQLYNLKKPSELRLTASLARRRDR